MASLPARSFVTRWQPPPESPFQRLANLAHDVGTVISRRAEMAGRADQLRLADRLRDAVERDGTQDAARELAAILRNRTDLDPATIHRLDTVSPPALVGPFPPSGKAATVAPSSPAASVAPPGSDVVGPPAGTLTEQAVRDVAFGKPGLRRRGYDEQSVDEFLDLVEADLRTRRAACAGAGAGAGGGAVVVRLTPADVKAVAFGRPPFGRRGYDERDVDLFLDEVERSFVVLDAELNRRGSAVARR